LRIRNRILVLMLGLFLPTGIGAVVVFRQFQRSVIISAIDHELYTAALMARELLPPGYHERIANKDSVPASEYAGIVDRFNRLCVQADLEYLWTLMVLDGEIVFTSATSPSKDAAWKDHAAFLDVHSNPEIYRQVFETMKPLAQINQDKWGRIRAVLIPFRDARGRPFLVGASRSMNQVDAEINSAQSISLLVAGVVLFLGVLGSVWMAGSLSRPIENLTRKAAAIAGGDLSQQTRVRGVRELEMLAKSVEEMRLAISARISDLEESEKRYRILFDSSCDAVFIHQGPDENGLPGRFVEVNDVACSRLGYSREELLEMRPPQIDAPETVQQIPEMMAILESQKHAVWEGIHVSQSGQRIPVEISNHLFDYRGKRAIFSAARDITERKEAERALQESERFLRLGERIARMGGWKVSPHANTLYWTEGVYHIVELPVERKMTLEEGLKCFAPEYIPRIQESLQNTLITDTPFVIEAEVITTSGKRLWAEIRGLARLDEAEGRYVTGTFQDINERKQAEQQRARLEEQLLQARKMESIGRLAGGVAHDFNNLLTPILGYAEMLRSSPDSASLKEEGLEQIYSAARKAKDLTGQLLAFGRKQMLNLKTVDLCEVVREIEKLMRRTIREDIRFELRLDDSPLFVRAEVGQIEQVLMNLAVNAQDAMPDGGALTIVLSKTVLDAAAAAVQPELKPGPYALLTVTDDGIGIEASVLDHLFEPFFTTKGKGKGTGLGLSTVFGIVKQHGGNLSVTSRPADGSCFTVLLPMISAPEGVPEKTIPVPQKAQGTETILVVEDSPSVLKIAQKMLCSLGYTVVMAQSAEQCLGLLSMQQEPIQLLLTDVIMPGMNGIQLYETLATRLPDLKVVYMSGYTDDLIAVRGVLRKGIDFLQKPFTVESLSRKIRDVLDAR
jgi:PAS domain S-box-containing protein